MGRPSSYTPEVAGAICELIETGHTSRQIDAMPAMPSWPTVCRWLDANEDFRKQYARARTLSAEALEAEVLHEVRTAETPEQVQKARVVLDAVKWSAAKRDPKRFGDKIDHTLANPDGTPLTIAVRRIVVKDA